MTHGAGLPGSCTDCRMPRAETWKKGWVVQTYRTFVFIRMDFHELWRHFQKSVCGRWGRVLVRVRVARCQADATWLGIFMILDDAVN